jgi:hypothetical protein
MTIKRRVQLEDNINEEVVNIDKNIQETIVQS